MSEETITDPGASFGPGSRPTDRAATRLDASRVDPSRVHAIYWEHARRGMTEWAEMLQGQIAAQAQAIARDAAHPLLAGYLAGRTAELHELASRLSAIRTVKDGWFRDSDGSPEGAAMMKDEG